MRAGADIPACVQPLKFTAFCHWLTLSTLRRDSFVYEYVGDVIGQAVFERKIKKYAQEGIKHFYFMALDKDVVRRILLPTFPTFGEGK